MTNKIFHIACLIYDCEREEIESTKRTVNLAMARYLMFALLTEAGDKPDKVIECLRRDRVMAYPHESASGGPSPSRQRFYQSIRQSKKHTFFNSITAIFHFIILR